MQSIWKTLGWDVSPPLDETSNLKQQAGDDDRESILKGVLDDWHTLGKVSENYRNDREVVLAAVSR